jgi:uncharacterized protein YbbC (DUF1343 family)
MRVSHSPLVLTGFLFIFLLEFCVPLPADSRSKSEPFRLGIDVLKENGVEILKGKKVGLVAHPASVNSKLIPTVDVLRTLPEVELVALFGPEHGVYGNEYAGVKVAGGVDPRTGLTIHSLYGSSRKPSPEMLKGLDALVFDLQDIGARSYTYISTMKLCLQACAEADIAFVVLDRPNPLGGERIEGPMVEKPFESFISLLNVPYVHGMTMGELARLVKEESHPHYDKLEVVKMSGWRRDMLWQDTRLSWVPTSPHIPYASTCASYAATGILGELGQVSVGVGYPQPFDLIGAPWIKGEALERTLNLYWGKAREVYPFLSSGSPFTVDPSPSPKGINFRTARFKPFYAIFKDQGCEGVQIYIDPRHAESIVEFNFRILWTLDAPKLIKASKPDKITMFHKACGTDAPRIWLEAGRPLEPLFAKWRASSEKFRESRARHLLY